MSEYKNIMSSLDAGGWPEGYLNSDASSNLIKDIRGWMTLVVDNNISGAITSLNNSGYKLPLNTTREALGKILLNIYYKDSAAFFDILNAVPYDPNTKNYTTDPAVHAKLQLLVNEMKGIKK